jgi:hypothetical protein
MLFWIVTGVAMVALLWFVVVIVLDDGASEIGWALGWLVMGTLGIGTVVVLFIVIPGVYMVGNAETETYTHEVVTASDGTGQHGDGGGNFLFYASMDRGTLTWSYYQREDDGSYSGQTLDEYDDVRIVEIGPDEQARVEHSMEITRPPSMIAPGFFTDENSVGWTLYVPRGTIQRNDFRFDLQ